MEFGSVSFIKSKYLNETIAVYNSTRKPGYVYKFSLKSANRYRCCRCFELKKERCITIENGSVKGYKHPEDDHHPDCAPVAVAVIQALQIDRDMRNEVRLFIEKYTISIIRNIRILILLGKNKLYTTTTCI